MIRARSATSSSRRWPRARPRSAGGDKALTISCPGSSISSGAMRSGGAGVYGIGLAALIALVPSWRELEREAGGPGLDLVAGQGLPEEGDLGVDDDDLGARLRILAELGQVGERHAQQLVEAHYRQVVDDPGAVDRHLDGAGGHQRRRPAGAGALALGDHLVARDLQGLHSRSAVAAL